MDKKNLENLKSEMNALGFSEKLTAEMEKKMSDGLSEFTLTDQVKGIKGEMELNLYFKQSSQSEFYYLNKFDVLKSEGRQLNAGENYRVTVNGESGQKVQNFERAYEAVGFFRAQGEPATISIANGSKIEPLVTVQEGQVILLDKDFGKTFRSPELPQTFWLDRGKGFSANQAINLVEGRAVHRDDMLTQSGKAYQAWFKMDVDGPRDKYMNYSMNQYNDPSYGFNLTDVLDKFNIKELEKPELRAKLEQSLKNGDRAEATVTKDGKKVQVLIEAEPRYSQINVFNTQGKSEKREQFLKEPSQSKEASVSKSKEKNVSAEQGLGI